MRLLSTTCRVDRRRYTPPINTQTLPHAICGCHDACGDHEFGAHEDQRARPADNPALGFDKLADLNSIDEMHVELDERSGDTIRNDWDHFLTTLRSKSRPRQLRKRCNIEAAWFQSISERTSKSSASP